MSQDMESKLPQQPREREDRGGRGAYHAIDRLLHSYALLPLHVHVGVVHGLHPWGARVAASWRHWALRAWRQWLHTNTCPQEPAAFIPLFFDSACTRSVSITC